MHIVRTIINSAFAPAGSWKCEVFFNSLAFYTTEILWNVISRTHSDAFKDVIPWSDAFSQLCFWTGHFRTFLVIYSCDLSTEMDPSHESDRKTHSKHKAQDCIFVLMDLLALKWLHSRKERLASKTIFRCCMVDDDTFPLLKQLLGNERNHKQGTYLTYTSWEAEQNVTQQAHRDCRYMYWEIWEPQNCWEYTYSAITNNWQYLWKAGHKKLIFTLIHHKTLHTAKYDIDDL